MPPKEHNGINHYLRLLLLDCQRYSSIRVIFLSKIETKIDDIRKLHENLISQLMNSNDYYVDIRLIMFVSSCFEIRDKLIRPLLEYSDNCYDLYQC